MRDRLAIRVRVRSERLRGLSVVREAIVWSVRSLRAAACGGRGAVWGALGWAVWVVWRVGTRDRSVRMGLWGV